MNNFLQLIQDKVLIYDGSKGTMLQKAGLSGGECPELWNTTHSDKVKEVYRSYKDAGSDMIQTNTFQGNRIKLQEYSLDDKTYTLNYEAVRLAKEVMGSDGYVAASIGPIGKLLEPMGDLTFTKAYDTFKEQVQAAKDGGADVINFETFTDLAEMRIALLAARESANLPVICTIAFEANGKTLMGTDPYVAAVVLQSLGADIIGTNCSLGPEHLVGIAKQMSLVGLPLCVKPNAGLPELIEGKVIYKETPENFAKYTQQFVGYGVRLIGGCCGTTPEYIKALKEKVSQLDIPKLSHKPSQIITSGVKYLSLEDQPTLNLGQINTSIDNTLSEELSKGNIDVIIDKAMDISCEGVDAVYINVDIPDSSTQLLADVVDTAQTYMKEPFIIETSRAEALNNALRIYKGKAGVIVDNSSTQVMEQLLSVSKKYGSTIVSRSVL